MKKFYSLVAAALFCCAGANAQTDLLSLPTSAEEAEAAGYSQMWSSYDYGCLVPAGTVLYSGDNITLTTVSDAYLQYTPAKGGKNVDEFANSPALCMSSTANNFYMTEAIYDFTSIAQTSSGKEGGALKLEPTDDGRITLYLGTGFNNRSMMVYDATLADEQSLPTLVHTCNIELGGDRGDSISALGVTDGVHVSTVDVTGGHVYYIFGTGNNPELYQITWTSFFDDAYQLTSVDDSECDAWFLDLAADATEAESMGYSQIWSSYEWGALIPAETVLYSGDAGTLTTVSEAYMAYEPTKGGKYCETFETYPFITMSSTANNFYMSEAIYDFTSIAQTSSGKQGGALKFEPVEDGRITLYFATGYNNRSMFVYDATLADEQSLPTYVLADNIELGGDRGDSIKALVTDNVDKMRVATVNVTGGSTYYIFGTGNSVELYQIAWTAMASDNYANTGYSSSSTTGISEISADATNAADGKVYTLDGRYMGNSVEGLCKGIYIKNGKKFVVK